MAKGAEKSVGPGTISVIIPFFNNRSTLSATIESILACRPAPDQVIAVDDGSTDGGASTIEDLPIERVRMEHAGRAAALNEGLHRAKGDLILFTDSDCTVPPDWTQAYRDLLATSDYAGVGGNLIPVRITAVETAKVLRYIHEFESDRKLSGSYNDTCLNGNNMAIRAEVFEKIGGFDTGYLHGADADLTRRMIEAGFLLFRTTQLRTMHHKVESLPEFLRTCFARGSTVRFVLDREDFGVAKALRAVVLAPVRNLILDLGRIPRLAVVDPKRSWLAVGMVAAFVNLMGGIVNGIGQVYFARRFSRMGR